MQLQAGCSFTPQSRLLHFSKRRKTHNWGGELKLKKKEKPQTSFKDDKWPLVFACLARLFLFSLESWRTFLLLYLNQCSPKCHETHCRSKPCSPGLCTWQYLDPTHICEIGVSTHIHRHHHLEEQRWKMSDILTLVQWNDTADCTLKFQLKASCFFSLQRTESGP